MEVSPFSRNDPFFNENIISRFYGNSRTEDLSAMLDKYPFLNAYWEDKVSKLRKIEDPACADGCELRGKLPCDYYL